MKHRCISKKVQMVNDHLRKPSSERADPKQFDLLLGEITIMHSRAELYIRFLRRRVKVIRIYIYIQYQFYLLYFIKVNNIFIIE